MCLDLLVILMSVDVDMKVHDMWTYRCRLVTRMEDAKISVAEIEDLGR